MTERGRFRIHDNSVRTRDEAKKTLVAIHKGRHHVAERNAEGDLEIFALHDEHGQPAIETSATNDRRPPTFADRNREAAAFWSRGRSAA
jgi:hypothetical protein